MTNYEWLQKCSLEEMADKIEMREFFAVAMNGTHDKRHKFAIEWLQEEYAERGLEHG